MSSTEQWQESTKASVNEDYINRFTLVATMALIVYDYLLTFKHEKHLVWPSRLSTMKIIFLLNRYLPFIYTAGLIYVVVLADVDKDDRMCKPAFLFFGSLLFLNYLVAELILYVRAYAVWERRQSIGIVLLLSFLLVIVLATVYTDIFDESLCVLKVSLLPTGCAVMYKDQINWVSLVVLIVSETFALAILLARSSHLLGYSKKIRMIFADGITYYIFILISSLLNVFTLRLASPNLCTFLLTTQGALHSIFCSRLLLNIRGAYESVSVSIRDNSGEARAFGSIDTISTFAAVDGTMPPQIYREMDVAVYSEVEVDDCNEDR